MLPKSQRLNLKKDFKWVAAGPRQGGAGKKLETKYLKIFIKLGDNEIPRIGIAVSSKTFTKAVERNRARRVTSAAIEPLYPSLPENINMIALPKIGVINVKSGDVLLDLEKVLKNEKIIN